MAKTELRPPKEPKKSKGSTSTDRKSQKEIARNLYMSNTMSQIMIADLVGTSQVTLSKWINEGNWDVLRGSEESSRSRILQNTLLRIAALTESWSAKENEDEPSPIKASADEVIKLTKVVESFSPNKISLSGQIETMKQYMSYLSRVNNSLAKETSEYAQDFIQTLVKNGIGSN